MHFLTVDFQIKFCTFSSPMQLYSIHKMRADLNPNKQTNTESWGAWSYSDLKDAPHDAGNLMRYFSQK